MQMWKKLIEEIGRTVRHALGSSDRTVRLCLIMTVGAGLLLFAGVMLLWAQTAKV